MIVLVLNAGSSSLKFQLIDTASKKWLYKGMIDRLGMQQSEFIAFTQKKSIRFKIKIPNIEKGVQLMAKMMFKENLLGKKKLNAIAHRVVHGGEKYTNPVIVTKKILQNLEKISPLAPLHNPYNLESIRAAQKILKGFPHIAVFDTGFYQTMPPENFLYAVPLQWYKKFGVRRYGFHGISHEYVTQETLKKLKKKTTRIISCHLGNGCSITASENGKAIHTSMGFTPLEGVIMGTRSGNIDPAIVPYLIKKLHCSVEEVIEKLNKDSGLKALGGASDMRDILKKAQQKNKSAILALEMFTGRIAEYIAAYATTLHGLDAIAFTGGIGENSPLVRKKILQHLTFLNLKKIKTFVIPTNEELLMAQKAENLLR